MKPSRRQFIQHTAMASTAIGLTSFLPDIQSRYTKGTSEKVHIAVVGSGMRGQSHIDLILRRNDCIVTCVAEPDAKMLDATKNLFEQAGAPQPKYYNQGNHDYVRMFETEKPDAVIIATPWEWHTQMAVASMKAGIYTGLEVAGAFSLDECWELVRTYESTGTPFYFLENVCFRRDVMAITQMVKQNLFGELIHLECGYQHDLRGVKFNDGMTPYHSGVEFGEKGMSEAKWRTWHSIYRNGDLYPTHGIGPVSNWINLNRGNRMESLVSMASKSRGLHNYILDHEKGGPAHPNASVHFNLGDKVTTLIKCNNGETIAMHHDTNLPRPYSLGFRVQGTKGLWMDVNGKLHIEGKSESHRWEDAASYLDEYDHPDWRAHADDAEGAGHGGMDWFLMESFIACFKNNTPPPIDVYDAASWMAITPLSEASISGGGTPQSFPDFTRGRWMNR